MNRTYLVVPLIGMLCFAGFYFYSRSHAPAAAPSATKPIDAYAARDGKQEAQAELAAGKLALIETGPAVSWDAERREIASSKYGVELRRPGDFTTEGFARYMDAFNRVMKPAIVAKHGRGFFDELHREAIALAESRKEGRKE
jgi:hypothetical protein